MRERVFALHGIVCLDDKNGMTFNGRRQSQDRYLRRRVADMVGDGTLWMNRYSAGQFADTPVPALSVREDFMAAAQEGEFCFVENVPLAPWADRIGTLFVFRWNRSYPADRFLDLLLDGWKLTGSEEFPGYSHERITLEVYQR